MITSVFVSCRVASAFISYSHEDQEFMLELVEQLQSQELEIRYDQVVLNIGDSLIERLSEEIAAETSS